MDPLTLAIIAAAIAALTAGTSATAAVMQNKQANESAQRQMELVQQQQAAQMAVARRQTEIEKAKRINEANLIRSRLRVAAGESGLGYGGTYNAMMRQADYDAGMNVRLLDENLANSFLAIGLGGQAQKASLVPMQASPLLSGITGGLQGFATGLAIGGAFQKKPSGKANSPAA